MPMTPSPPRERPKHSAVLRSRASRPLALDSQPRSSSEGSVVLRRNNYPSGVDIALSLGGVQKQPEAVVILERVRTSGRSPTPPSFSRYRDPGDTHTARPSSPSARSPALVRRVNGKLRANQLPASYPLPSARQRSAAFDGSLPNLSFVDHDAAQEEPMSDWSKTLPQPPCRSSSPFRPFAPATYVPMIFRTPPSPPSSPKHDEPIEETRPLSSLARHAAVRGPIDDADQEEMKYAESLPILRSPKKRNTRERFHRVPGVDWLLTDSQVVEWAERQKFATERSRWGRAPMPLRPPSPVEGALVAEPYLSTTSESDCESDDSVVAPPRNSPPTMRPSFSRASWQRAPEPPKPKATVDATWQIRVGAKDFGGAAPYLGPMNGDFGPGVRASLF